jgi:hypothetical protein
MLLAQTDELVGGSVEFAKEFGLEGFLLTAILFGLAFGLWKIGGRVADALIVSVSNIAESGRQTSEATKGIKNAVDLMASHNISIDEQLKSINLNTTDHSTQNSKILNTQLALISILMQQPNINDHVRTTLNSVYEEVKKQDHTIYRP